jgi:hypothetical protein
LELVPLEKYEEETWELVGPIIGERKRSPPIIFTISPFHKRARIIDHHPEYFHQTKHPTIPPTLLTMRFSANSHPLSQVH